MRTCDGLPNSVQAKCTSSYHVCDDVTGKVLPVCGADIELSNDGDATGLIEQIGRGVAPLFPDPLYDEARRRMCGRCQKVCLRRRV